MSATGKRVVELTEAQLWHVLGAVGFREDHADGIAYAPGEARALTGASAALRHALHDCPGSGRPAVRGRVGTAVCRVCGQGPAAIGYAETAYFPGRDIRIAGRHDRLAPSRGDTW